MTTPSLQAALVSAVARMDLRAATKALEAGSHPNVPTPTSGDRRAQARLPVQELFQALDRLQNAHEDWLPSNHRHVQRAVALLGALAAHGADLGMACPDPQHPEDAAHPLLRAAQLQQPNLVRCVLRHAPEQATRRYDWNDTALHVLIRESYGRVPDEAQTSMVRQLVKAGCPVNAVNTQGETPLYLAASKARLPAVHALLKLGGDVFPTNGPWPLSGWVYHTVFHAHDEQASLAIFELLRAAMDARVAKQPDQRTALVACLQEERQRLQQWRAAERAGVQLLGDQSNGAVMQRFQGWADSYLVGHALAQSLSGEPSAHRRMRL